MVRNVWWVGTVVDSLKNGLSIAGIKTHLMMVCCIGIRKLGCKSEVCFLSSRYYGSDGLRSPLDRYRSPGDPEYTGP